MQLTRDSYLLRKATGVAREDPYDLTRFVSLHLASGIRGLIPSGD